MVEWKTISLTVFLIEEIFTPEEELIRASPIRPLSCELGEWSSEMPRPAASITFMRRLGRLQHI